MLDEIVEEEDTALIFAQFSEMCFRHNRNTENDSQNVTGEIED